MSSFSKPLHFLLKLSPLNLTLRPLSLQFNPISTYSSKPNRHLKQKMLSQTSTEPWTSARSPPSSSTSKTSSPPKRTAPFSSEISRKRWVSSKNGTSFCNPEAPFGVQSLGGSNSRSPIVVKHTEKAPRMSCDEAATRELMEPILLVRNLRKVLMMSIDCQILMEKIEFIEMNWVCKKNSKVA